MGYSNDLRVRVIRVVEGGVAARAAARQFVIGDATAIRWVKRWRETGSFEARSVRGQSRSPPPRRAIPEWTGRPGGFGGGPAPDPFPNSAVKTPSAHGTVSQGTGE